MCSKIILFLLKVLQRIYFKLNPTTAYKSPYTLQLSFTIYKHDTSSLIYQCHYPFQYTIEENPYFIDFNSFLESFVSHTIEKVNLLKTT